MFHPLIKILRLLGLIFAGLVTALLLYPKMDRHARDRQLMAWAKRMICILNIELRVNGTLPVGGTVLVANHVSWLDIHVLHSLLPVRFIAKAEVGDWPLLGHLAKAAGTLFISREKRSDALRVNQEMADELQAGECLAFFPEGTTSDGLALRPFHPSLFQPAIEAACPLIPTCIQYFNVQGSQCLEAAYHGDMTLLASLWRIVNVPGLQVVISFLPTLSTKLIRRRELAKQAEAAIRSALENQERGR